MAPGADPEVGAEAGRASRVGGWWAAVAAVWGGALRTVVSHPWALAVPALAVSLVSDSFELLPLTDGVSTAVETVITTYLYFLFLAYVEHVADHHHGGGGRIAPRDATRMAGRAARAAPVIAVTGTVLLLAAAVVVLLGALTVGVAVLGIGETDSLVIGVLVAFLLAAVALGSGLWFIGRSGLTVSSMVVERHGPVSGVRRSFALTRRRTPLALATVGLALVLEVGGDSSASALLESPLEDGRWPLWLCGVLIEALVTMLTATVIAGAYAHMAAAGPLPSRRAERRG